MSTASDFRADDASVARSYARVQPELAALPAKHVRTLNLSPSQAIDTILSALPRLRAFRGRIVKELPTFDLAAFDKLGDYTLAFRYTDDCIENLSSAEQAKLMRTATPLRERLNVEARALAVVKLLDSRELVELKGTRGAGTTAADLQLLSQIFLANWAGIKKHVTSSLVDVQAAGALGKRLVQLLEAREQHATRMNAALELRARAFTLVLRTYNDARAAIDYLRRNEGDVDLIAPCLYPGRAGQGRKRAKARAAARGPLPSRFN